MNTFTKTVALAALMTGVAGSAHAVEGWYGSITGGYSVGGELSFDEFEADFENNWMAATVIGHSLGTNWRLEGELSYRQNDIES